MAHTDDDLLAILPGGHRIYASDVDHWLDAPSRLRFAFMVVVVLVFVVGLGFIESWLS
jgi:hypothetical protein